MSQNNFSERYKIKTSPELVAILDDPDSYQPEAVEAARLELHSRQLTNDQLEAARAELHASATEKERKNKHQTIDEDINLTADDFPSDILDPIQTIKTPSTDKDIKLIAIYLGSLFLYHFYFKSGIFVYLFTADLIEFDTRFIDYTLPLVVLPTSAVLIFRKKRLGWILAVFFATVAAATAVEGLMVDLLSEPVEIMNVVIPSVPLIFYVIPLVFEGGVAWPLCRPKIRKVYGIDERVMYSTIGSGVVYTLLIWFLFIRI